MTAGIGPELGDAIYCLPTIRELGARTLVSVQVPFCRPNWHHRAKAAKRLFESQGYVDSFTPWNNEVIDIDLTSYRSGGGRYGETIASKVARWARVSLDLSKPWLEVVPSKKSKGRIVVNRCPRWLGVRFPWKELVKAYQRDMMFIGLESEWKAFSAEFGVVEYARTADLLEAAELIAGSELFIGNQSSCNAICEGLKRKNILEVCPPSNDCWFGRKSTTYVVTGEIHQEILGRPFHHTPEVKGLGWSFMLQETAIQHAEKNTCEMMARAEHVCRGIPLPTIAEIQARMVPR